MEEQAKCPNCGSADIHQADEDSDFVICENCQAEWPTD